MENVRKNLVKFAKIYSMDSDNPQSMETLYQVLVREDKKYHNSVIIPAIKVMSEKGYRNFIDHIVMNGDLEHVWLFDLYRNAPDDEAEACL